ncbi:tRNA glutamyl-Q(34) synthetase GluQRS [Alteromonas sp. A081]|uniref:tRNA glutamyl-Q(34) synthetase GluQRS n=1 Tax=Alteromonas sp. A081 TaxID=3410269 RepID=UPI003B984CAF
MHNCLKQHFDRHSQERSSATTKYTGRFAPSPSGRLHFGSLVTALASYLDAKHHNGKWLVRMEDIDEPRCIAGNDTAILHSLESHGLQWDGEVMYQSKQHPRYQDVVDALLHDGQAYYCSCTRKMIKAMGGTYNGHCRDKGLRPSNEPLAIRLKLDTPLASFTDLIMGEVSAPHQKLADQSVDEHTTIARPVVKAQGIEDLTIRRRDQLFSYNLVVVLDDVFQGVTHVIRGCDLLDVTPLHRCVHHTLGYQTLQYGHVPVAAIAPGRKLSKQNHATPIDDTTALKNIVSALHFLGFDEVKRQDFDSIDSLLSFAVSLWDRKKVVKTPEIIVHQHESTYDSVP